MVVEYAFATSSFNSTRLIPLSTEFNTLASIYDQSQKDRYSACGMSGPDEGYSIVEGQFLELNDGIMKFLKEVMSAASDSGGSFWPLRVQPAGEDDRITISWVFEKHEA